MPKTPQAILDKIAEAKAKQLKELDLSWPLSVIEKLRHIPPELLTLTHLEVLKLSGHELTTLPEALRQLPQLRTLCLSWQPETSPPEWLAQLPELSLDLSGQKLTNMPGWVFRLQNLTRLDLSSNRLTRLTEEISRLQNLVELNLRGNPLTTLPKALCRLPILKTLCLSWQGETPPPEWLTQLPELSLDLSNNELTEVPSWIFHLQNLTWLDLKLNHLITLPRETTHLPNLAWLDLSDNSLTTLPPEIGQLSNLTELDLTHNNLTMLPEEIVPLSNLTRLYLSDNQLTRLPERLITQLPNLIELDLSYNRLTILPPGINQLTNLAELNLSSNFLTILPEEIIHLPNLTWLGLGDNPLETPRPEVAAQGIKALRDYFRQLAQAGQDHLYEAKLLIVGEPGAGKTTLARKIVNPTYQLHADEPSTEGIEVLTWQFPLEDGRPFRVNLWDFGGQEIYHATHQFFLTKRSLYLLVADTRQEDTDFYHWLNVVELLSDNSPLLIIKNEKQDRRRELNERQLRGQFTNLQKSLPTNLATNRGLETILAEIRYHLRLLPHVGVTLPKTWVQVRQALEQDPRNYISLAEYLDICEQHGFKRREDKLQLSDYLHDLGVCLHFQEDPLLNKTVILKPAWGTAAVYKVLGNARVANNFGRFSRADLAEIWVEADYTEMQPELLRLMLNFQLCYPLPGPAESYIAPQLLGQNQPDYTWEETDNLRLRYRYEFMPKGLLTRFIVAMHPYILQQRYVWRSGVILDKDKTRAEMIEYYDRREITIRVAGRHKRDLLTTVVYELEKIHAAFPRLKYSRLIPCNCPQCKSDQSPYFYEYDILRRFMADRQAEIQCVQSYRMVNVRGLLDDVIDEARLWAETEPFQDGFGDGGIAFSHISGSTIVIGGGLTANVKTGGDLVGGSKTIVAGPTAAQPDLSALLRPIYQQIQAQSWPADEQDELNQHLQKLEQELAAGAAASPDRVARRLKIMAALAPEAFELVVEALRSATGLPPGIRQALESAADRK
jgi:Leucine-rich repeat (LRR) protein